jgi:hypothetical protein
MFISLVALSQVPMAVRPMYDAIASVLQASSFYLVVPLDSKVGPKCIRWLLLIRMVLYKTANSFRVREECNLEETSFRLGCYLQTRLSAAQLGSVWARVARP